MLKEPDLEAAVEIMSPEMLWMGAQCPACIHPARVPLPYLLWINIAFSRACEVRMVISC
jgi:hypothetical protein